MNAPQADRFETTSPDAVTPDEAAAIDAVAAFHQEHHRNASLTQRGIDALTNRLGRPVTLLAILTGVSIWAFLAGRTANGHVDTPAFGWLELAATIAALVIAMVILVTQRREDELAERRAQLTLQLALLADKKNAKIIALLEELRRDAPYIADRVDVESTAMATPADPQAFVAAIDAASDGD